MKAEVLIMEPKVGHWSWRFQTCDDNVIREDRNLPSFSIAIREATLPSRKHRKIRLALSNGDLFVLTPEE